jgi:glycosyltransferase involved in cell wall biosynthesis
MKCLHIATLHPRHDSRILTKECVSLARAGHDVGLLVGDGAGNEQFGDVRILDMGLPPGKLASRVVPMWRAMRHVLREAPDVVHFHDPMFLPFAIMLAIMRVRVIYDVHEDYPRQVLTWRFGWPIRYMASVVYGLLEWLGGFAFSKIVAVTPTIADRFPPTKTILVRNFPLLDELHAPDPTPMAERPEEFTYVGSITEERNIFGMIEAVARVPGRRARLRLAGDFSSAEIKGQAQEMPEWASVTFEGWVSRAQVAAILADGRAGLVVLKPVPHEMVTLPIKLFEYMAAGMPVIASDFPLWRAIVEEAQCGVLVDPTRVDDLVRAMQSILEDPAEAQAMGARGRRAVVDKYNWDFEAVKLIDCYRTIAPASRSA